MQIVLHFFGERGDHLGQSTAAWAQAYYENYNHSVAMIV